MDFESIKRLGLDHYNIDLTKSYEIYDPSTNNHTIHLYLLKDKTIVCQNCGSIDISIKGSVKSSINYSSPLENNITIILHKRQYRCNDCNKTFYQSNPIISEGKNISIQKDFNILQALRDKNKTFTQVAKDFNISPTYVQNLFDKKVSLKRLSLPNVLCIDEVYSKRLTKHKYCCVLYAPQWKSIVDILPSRHKLNLIDYFAKIPISEKDNVKFISMDLWDSYRDVAKLCLPKAKICADPFHVIKHLIECFKRIRIDVMKKYEHLKYEQSNYYWLFKKYFNFLETDLSKLPDHPIRVSHSGMYMTKYQIITFMLSVSNELKLAYELKEDYRSFNCVASIDNAEEMLDELIIKFKASNLKEYAPFWRILINWHDEIINSFNRINGNKITNGPMERINKDIKNLFSISFDSTNFERVRNRIIFCINKNAPILGYRKNTTNKRIGKPRGSYKK